MVPKSSDSTSTRRAPATREPAARLAGHVVAARQGNRTILLDMRAVRYYSLDGVGGEIWSLLQAGVGLEEIEARLADEYDAPREQIGRDLAALLDQFRRKGWMS